jgi:hypothetical protein
MVMTMDEYEEAAWLGINDGRRALGLPEIEIHTRLGFTQRDVDPLGRGDAAQQGVEVCAYDGYEIDDPGHSSVHDQAVDEWRALPAIAYVDAQRSDQAKCDESTLRSGPS